MRSVYDFIVKPTSSRYSNEKKVGNKKLLLNTSIEEFKFINREAIVVSVPLFFDTPIKPGDRIIIHHNVFRRYYNQKGKAVDSSKLFRDDLFFCQLDQIYLYERDGKWLSINDRCFIIPIKNRNAFSLDKEEKNIGVVKIGNSNLESLNINPGDLVGYKSNREFEFMVDNKRLYCMQSNDILLKYGYKGNEEEYNRSWAESC
jgi:co-chaperonin GroES (HSP10)